MKDTKTPETDAKVCLKWGNIGYVEADFCRSMEAQRNAARASSQKWQKMFNEADEAIRIIQCEILGDNDLWGDHVADRVRNALTEAREREAELAAIITELLSITYESEGVVGWHLTGDIAWWSEFLVITRAEKALAQTGKEFSPKSDNSDSDAKNALALLRTKNAKHVSDAETLAMLSLYNVRDGLSFAEVIRYAGLDRSSLASVLNRLKDRSEVIRECGRWKLTKSGNDLVREILTGKEQG